MNCGNLVFLCSCLYYFVEAASEIRDRFIHCLTELWLHEFAPPVVAAAEKTELKLPDYYHWGLPYEGNMQGKGCSVSPLCDIHHEIMKDTQEVHKPLSKCNIGLTISGNLHQWLKRAKGNINMTRASRSALISSLLWSETSFIFGPSRKSRTSFCWPESSPVGHTLNKLVSFFKAVLPFFPVSSF